MSQHVQAIRRQGLNTAFEVEEAKKSNLILEARLLREQGQDEAAAAKFAQAAEIEEQLSDLCALQGLAEKSFVHQFSAASCWAQAGDFYHAIVLCDGLLARPNLPARLRQRVAEHLDTLRARRAQWYAGLALETSGVEG